MDWIKVEDEQPKTDDWYVVWLSGDIKFETPSGWDKVFWSNEWQSFAIDPFCGEVTHWQPIEPPGESEEDDERM